MVDLPNEITISILANLPVKSLLRFKCVSTPWCRWISSPNFQPPNQRLQGLLTALHTRPRRSFCFINHQLTSEELYCPNFMKRVKTNNRKYLNSCRLLGSCHGLVLISINEHIFLWNPATRFNTKVLELDRLTDVDYATHGALCFDSSKNDYKALVFMFHQTPEYGGEFAIVASLKGKKWRLPKFPYKNISSVRDGVTLHGRPHYRISVNNSDSYKSNGGQDDDSDGEDWTDHWARAFGPPNKVIYFDPVSENFHMLPVPEPKYDKENVIVGLGILNECLCMTRLGDDKGVEILVMKEYGEKESWTSLFIMSNKFLEINPSYGVAEPFSMTENGELGLIVLERGIRVVAYNTKNDNMYDIIDVGDAYFSMSAIKYVESLISPKAYYWSEKRHKKFGSLTTCLRAC